MRTEKFRTACLKVLPQAQKIGGKRLVSQLLILAQYSGEESVPLKKAWALKYRGVGMTAIRFLEEVGLVGSDLAELNELSSRTRNVLLNAGIKNKAKAKQVILSGNKNYKDIKIRNYGVNTHKEVCGWLGLSPSTGKPQTIKFISVEDKLPGKDAVVLAATTNPPMIIPGVFDGRNWKPHGWGRFLGKVEHWAPMPKGFLKKLEASREHGGHRE
jgi:hypothetical protein